MLYISVLVFKVRYVGTGETLTRDIQEYHSILYNLPPF